MIERLVERPWRSRQSRRNFSNKVSKKSEKSFGGFEKVITFVAPLKGKRVLAIERRFKEKRLSEKNTRK